MENSIKDIKKAAIIGAGAIGAYVYWGLVEKMGDNIFLIAEGERNERLKKDGLNINERHYIPRVLTADEAKEEAPDLIIVSVKYNALSEAAELASRAAGDDTIVMSLMNGIDSEEIIREKLNGRGHVIYSLIRIASGRVGNTINFQEPSGARMGIMLGDEEVDGIISKDGDGTALERTSSEKSDFEKNNFPASSHLTAVGNLFEGTRLVYRYSENIKRDIWLKFISNISMNLPQAVLSVGIGANTDSPYVDDLEKKLSDETAAVARALGVDLGQVDEAAFRQGYTPDPKTRYSTLQDLDAGRQTEIEMFSGALIKMGKRAGVPTPYNEIIYDLIKALEEKNAGKFDYE